VKVFELLRLLFPFSLLRPELQVAKFSEEFLLLVDLPVICFFVLLNLSKPLQLKNTSVHFKRLCKMTKRTLPNR